MSKSEKYTHVISVFLFLCLVFAVLTYFPPANRPRDYMFSGCLQDPGALARTFDLVAFSVAWCSVFLFYCLATGVAVAVVYFVLVRAPVVSFVTVRDFVRKRYEASSAPNIPKTPAGVVFPGLSWKDYVKDMILLHGSRFITGRFVLFVIAVGVASVAWMTLFVTSAPRLCLTDNSTTHIFHLIIIGFSLLAAGASALSWSYVVEKYQVPIANYVSTRLRVASVLLEDRYSYKSRTELEKAMFGDNVPYVVDSVFGKNFRVDTTIRSKWRACVIVINNTATLFFSNSHRCDVRTVYCVETYTFSTKYPGRSEVFSLLCGKLNTLNEYGADIPSEVAENGKVKF